jgi:hypothetical protein
LAAAEIPEAVTGISSESGSSANDDAFDATPVALLDMALEQKRH